MTKLFLDTDVLMDFLSKREPYAQEAAMLFDLCEKKKIRIYISSLCLGNLYYLLRKLIGHKRTIDLLKTLTELVDILAVDKKVVLEALHSGFSDFEDGLQHFTAAQSEEIEAIVTRNLKDFKESRIVVMTARSFVEMLKVKNKGI